MSLSTLFICLDLPSFAIYYFPATTGVKQGFMRSVVLQITKPRLRKTSCSVDLLVGPSLSTVPAAQGLPCPAARPGLTCPGSRSAHSASGPAWRPGLLPIRLYPDLRRTREQIPHPDSFLSKKIEVITLNPEIGLQIFVPHRWMDHKLSVEHYQIGSFGELFNGQR